MNLGVQCYIFATYSQTKLAVKFSSDNVNSIIFDLGGVVLNLNPQNTIDAFIKITDLSQDELLAHRSDDVFISFEKGKISPFEFRLGLRNLFNVDVSDNVLDVAWNAMLLDLPMNRLEMIGNLRSNYKTFVLSNTNEIHIAAFDGIVHKTTGGNHIENYFDKVYYSHKVNMRKPDTEIFEMVINNNSLDPTATLFIDDTLEHIESARLLGLQTWHLTNQEELFSAFDNG